MVRLKTRYLLFQILYPTDTLASSEDAKTRFMKIHRVSDDTIVNARNLTQIFKEEMETLHGDLGSGSIQTTINVKYFSPVTSTGILRVGRQHTRQLWAALTHITDIDNVPVVINVVHVSGTIRKCEQAAIERNRKIVRYLQSSSKSHQDMPEERLTMDYSDNDD